MAALALLKFLVITSHWGGIDTHDPCRPTLTQFQEGKKCFEERFIAARAYIEFDLRYCVDKAAQMMSANLPFFGGAFKSKDEFIFRLVTTPCPCNNELCGQGAHNHPSYVTTGRSPARRQDGAVSSCQGTHRCPSNAQNVAPLHTSEANRRESNGTEEACDDPDSHREVDDAIRIRFFCIEFRTLPFSP